MTTEPQTASPSRRRRVTQWTLISILALMVLYSLAGFLVLPWWIESYGARMLGDRLQRPVTVAEAAFNPFKFTLQLKDVSIREADDQPLVSVGQIFVDLEPSAYLGGTATVRTVEIDRPEVFLLRMPDGRINLAQLAQPGEPEPVQEEEKGEPVDFLVVDFTLSDGKVVFRDETAGGFETIAFPIDVKVANLTNQADQKATYALAMATDVGEGIKLEGNLSLANAVATEGRLDVSAAPLDHYAPYYKNFVGFEKAAGHVDLVLGYRYAGARMIISDLAITLAELILRNPADGEAFLTVPQLTVSGGRIDTQARTVTVQRIGIDGLTASARRAADGRIDLVGLISPPITSAETPPASPAAVAAEDQETPVPAWTFNLGVLVLEDHGLSFLDQVPAPDAKITVDQLALKVENFSTVAGNRPSVDLTCRINQAGTLAVGGEVALNPFASELTVILKGLPLKPFQPYLNDHVDLGITEGRLGAKGRLTLALPKDEPPRVQYRGSAEISRFAAVDKRDNKNFLLWKSLFIEGADLATEPMKITVGRVALSDYYARVVITAEGKFNAEQIFSPSDEAPASSPEKPRGTEKPSPLRLNVNEITLQGGEVDFSDYFTQPNFQTRMVELGGRVTDLSTHASTPAEVMIQGALKNQSPLEITGQINPLSQDKDTDVKLTFRNIELSPLSPYSGKYLGYTLARGKLTLELDYKIAERQLQARNRIFFDALTLGDRVESPDATSLPIKLVLALLTDRQGRIELDVPVKGNLDDPQFSVFGIVIKALGNLLTKIITSPFDALASAFGGQVVTHLDFNPGQSTLSQEDETQITGLADALHERPALRLEIQGCADPQTDAPEIRQELLGQLLRGVKRRSLAAADQADVPLKEIQISTAERPEIIAQAYAAAEFPKPRDEDGKEKALPPEEMEKLLFTQIHVDENDLHQLAKARAAAVRERLLADARIRADRVFLLEPKVEKTEDPDAGRRVKFGLR